MRHQHFCVKKCRKKKMEAICILKFFVSKESKVTEVRSIQSGQDNNNILWVMSFLLVYNYVSIFFLSFSLYNYALTAELSEIQIRCCFMLCFVLMAYDYRKIQTDMFRNNNELQRSGCLVSSYYAGSLHKINVHVGPFYIY